MKALNKLAKSPVARKGRAYLKQVPRFVRRLSSSKEDYEKFPPVLVNSLPKSGTHLLLQIAEALPDTRNFGSFIAQRPSMSVRVRSQDQINRMIDRIVPGEVVASHLHYSAEAAAKLNEKNVVHLFIYRNPIDVILSEVAYLSEMAPWNALHKRFARLDRLDDRLNLAIEGDGTPEYPNASERYAPFLSWLKDDKVNLFRYEDLMSPSLQLSEMRRIAEVFLERRCSESSDVEYLASHLSKNIVPERSHTYRADEKKKMSPTLNESQRKRVKELFFWLTDDR